MTRDTSQPGECPAPEVHGNPFRYCPYCTWIESQPERHPDLPAMAAYGAFCISTAIPLGDMPSWDHLPPEVRADWRAVADAVLMVAGRGTPDGDTQ